MLYIIANETAGSGAGAAVFARVCAMLQEKGIPFHADKTEAPGHAVRLADAAVRAGETEIACLGGDGTISEIVNGLAGRFVTLYFIPCGTGNDFVRVLGLPKDPVEALAAQLSGTPGKIDVGMLNDMYFMNVSGSGFDVEVLRQAARFKRLGKGLFPYLLGIFAALRKFRALPVEITLDGKTEKKEVTIFSVGNGCWFGGGWLGCLHLGSRHRGMLGGIDGLLQFHLEGDAVYVYLGNVAFYFGDFNFVVHAFYFILILVHGFSIILEL